VLSFLNTSTAPLSIKCFFVYLDSCILHVSYAPLSSWSRGIDVYLPSSAPWGQINDILVCTFAGPMPVVLVVVAHQLNPSRTLRCVCHPSGAPACPLLPAPCRVAKSGALVRGHEGQGALFGGCDPVAAAARKPRRQCLDTGVRQEYAGGHYGCTF
jgi:hypothetical protein